MKLKNFAFTLAEILITLGIIGIIASLTLPPLIQKYHEKQRIVQLKKTYSVLQNAFLMAKAEYGEVTDLGLTITNTGRYDANGNLILDNTGGVNVINKLAKYIEKSSIPQKTYIGYVQSLDGRKAYWPWQVKSDRFFYLKDGTIVAMGWIHNLDCTSTYGNQKNVCSDAWIVFPKKSTIKIGVDVFNFVLTTDGFKPTADLNWCNAFSSAYSADTNGRGCSAWALYKGNMDYLHKKIR